VQFEIKSGIDSDDLKTVTIKKNELKNIVWLEPGKEMSYNNQFYDIVKSTETSVSTTFYCINDTQEESLFTNLEEHINTQVAANKPIKNENQKKIADTVIKLFFSNKPAIIYSAIPYNQHQFFLSTTIYNSAFIETDSPPPEFS